MNVPGGKKRNPMQVTTESPEVTSPAMTVHPPKQQEPAPEEQKREGGEETNNG